MAYAVYVNHPETWERREADFAVWNSWAEQNAPWTGVGIDHMAAILDTVCALGNQPEICGVLDTGGDLTPEAARIVLKLAEDRMQPDTRKVFSQAVRGGYGVRVVFSKALGAALTASAYLAKFGSA